MEGNGASPEPDTASPAGELPRDVNANEPHRQPQELSKTQKKKLLKKQQWEEGKEERRERRRVKKKEQRSRKRAAKHQHVDENSNRSAENECGIAGEDGNDKAELATAKHRLQTTVPLAIVIDCQFNDLMREGELISLGTQLTRSYSTNRKAMCRVHLAVSSFGGALKERFDSVLNSHHKNWHGVLFSEDKFDLVAANARRVVRNKSGENIVGALSGQTISHIEKDLGNYEDIQSAQTTTQSHSNSATSARAVVDDIVYLTSDSPDTIYTLQAGTVYIVGGLVDKNRHKGICYKAALDAGVRTARLPIGEHIRLASRAVLTTNQVIEIMINWLETGDWASAFLKAIPKRKGCEIREDEGQQHSAVTNEEHECNETENDVIRNSSSE